MQPMASTSNKAFPTSDSPFTTELRHTACRLAARGILAADESPATMGKRLAPHGVENTQQSRSELRRLLFSTPSLSRSLSGVLFHEETLADAQLVEVVSKAGLLVGVKLDSGLRELPACGGGSWTAGLDALDTKAGDAYAKGARFAKWRAVFNVPSSAVAIATSTTDLARYAAIVQRRGLVPIVEPEVLRDGSHSIEAAAATATAVLSSLFAACVAHGVDLDAAVLKPSMVTTGADEPVHASPEEVASATLRVLRATVPPAVPAVLFLSGGQSDDDATDNLRAIAAKAAASPRRHPWSLSFSFGRALERKAMGAWKGDAKNAEQVQAALAERCRACAAAACGVEDEEDECDEHRRLEEVMGPPVIIDVSTFE